MINVEVMEKLWAPFFTTNSKERGLGLPICKRIVEAHKCSKQVETAVVKGATFVITLPNKTKTERR